MLQLINVKFKVLFRKMSSIPILGGFALTVLLYSCEEKQILTIENEKIKIELLARQKTFRDSELAKCRLSVIESAQDYVDSLISSESVFRINDSIIFPEKPIKPPSFGPIQIVDTLRAKPIFK